MPSKWVSECWLQHGVQHRVKPSWSMGWRSQNVCHSRTDHLVGSSAPVYPDCHSTSQRETFEQLRLRNVEQDGVAKISVKNTLRLDEIEFHKCPRHDVLSIL